MKLFKTISNIAAFWGVVLMVLVWLYACARVKLAIAGYWRAKAKTEQLKTNIVREES